MTHPETEIESLEELQARLGEGRGLAGAVLQGLDLTGLGARLAGHDLGRTLFLGCTMPPELAARAAAQGALVFPALPARPYATVRGRLYTTEELYAGFAPARPESYQGTLDARVYAHFMAHGGTSPSTHLELLGQALHDHSITDALGEFLAGVDPHPSRDGRPRHVVAVMGGHSLARGSAAYRQAAELGRDLARAGLTLATGGGPGAMEAAHLGAWLAGYGDEDLRAALGALAEAPSYKDRLWLARGFEVRTRFPARALAGGAVPESLGVPTWTYGHEPPNPFATHVAKYFQNALREDGLLALAKGGVVFTPGSAGTVQEIFQDACQNHYETQGPASPMVFLGREYWTSTLPVWPLVTRLAGTRAYGRLLTLTDDLAEATAVLAAYRPVG